LAVAKFCRKNFGEVWDGLNAMEASMTELKEWLVLLVAAVPLFTLTGTLIGYLLARRRESELREYSDYIAIVNSLGGANSTLIGNVASSYMLRNFPKYAKATERVAQRAEEAGPQMPLTAELKDTVEWLRSQGHL
jgi:NAD/NADP transhydrogenase beta subunit